MQILDKQKNAKERVQSFQGLLFGDILLYVKQQRSKDYSSVGESSSVMTWGFLFIKFCSLNVVKCVINWLWVELTLNNFVISASQRVTEW